jgi:uncharacterized protein YndB with AHSA1/START domain
MDSLHEIEISAPAAKVFDTWTTKDGLRAWWTGDVTVPRAKGESYVFGFDDGNVKFHFRVVNEVPGVSARWVGVAGPGMPAEWIDTEIDVRLSKAEGDRTRLQFAHRNWRSIEGAYCVCNTTWGELMYRLRDYCEGKPRGALFSG